MKKLKFILSGGGTGGHIYPAIAIADELKKRHPEAEFLFVGAKDRMEMQKVPKAGYNIKGLWISGLQRKLSLKNALFPLKLISSILKAHQILSEFKPHVVIGTGGFASGPLLKAANQQKIPTLLQEQNSYAGITNKWLASNAKSICVAYENMENYFPKEKIRFTGNPVRQDLLEINSKREEAINFFKLDKTKKTVLVLGGSLGARKINQHIEKHIPYFEDENVQVIWQTGKLYFLDYKHYEASPHFKIYEYLDHMALAYAAADIIISRAGAGSVSELCVVGKPVIFIPSPNVAEDHQTKNAQSIANKNAAILIKETDLEQNFKKAFTKLLASEEQQKMLSENIRKIAKPHATKAIVDEVEKLINPTL
ncbi:undecaprenyldiphospho-muramoylpentapeptide beta-N-acetylglucosaminyltransferase [Mesonia maritima]|uniref:UDP-N-acetylglucosamine--N-acetylmuramyl-(pentapeptide) pyrophosphoryl-undecaprenol N-acetylglucosamine transferase n=1 Tax=Mesonia maritima TaxID=1793873 RepID=A0ABU1K8Z9_9FLAO|nr:undecaprenyldiphospho-muramoylpentapeptide beta-N-acetylglucosaminyltransferase [Mesonia maritima]MDR6302070.1 UDP-N-acetylglucosamine--N-acetylmuramyl-(pentapeptide) pyrophosphoryl-undecaprenol N-acetylglucosamine transferase [Mesonia maritima]